MNISLLYLIILYNVTASIEKPTYVKEHSLFILNNALERDTHFLSTHLIMDYSLLIGLDTTRNQLLVGIIGSYIIEIPSFILVEFLILDMNTSI